MTNLPTSTPEALLLMTCSCINNLNKYSSVKLTIFEVSLVSCHHISNDKMSVQARQSPQACVSNSINLYVLHVVMHVLYISQCIQCKSQWMLCLWSVMCSWASLLMLKTMTSKSVFQLTCHSVCVCVCLHAHLHKQHTWMHSRWCMVGCQDYIWLLSRFMHRLRLGCTGSNRWMWHASVVSIHSAPNPSGWGANPAP